MTAQYCAFVNLNDLKRRRDMVFLAFQQSHYTKYHWWHLFRALAKQYQDTKIAYEERWQPARRVNNYHG